MADERVLAGQSALGEAELEDFRRVVGLIRQAQRLLQNSLSQLPIPAKRGGGEP
jgi:hypothetical protein